MKSKQGYRYIYTTIIGLALLLLPFKTVQGKKFPISKKHKEFLSQVYYIISKDESKFFRHLPKAKRKEFIRNFWDIRDPFPDTLENEFKEEYLKRIEDANRMFSSARAGWLTDRGKTYILLGPPRHIADYPTGSFAGTSYRRPFVVFHYEEVYLLFLENKNDGDYQVSYTGMYHHSLVQKAFAKAKRQINVMEDLFEYNFKYKKIDNTPHLVFTVKPAKLNFKKQDKKMVSELEITVIIKDNDYNEIFKETKKHVLAFNTEIDGSGRETGTEIPEKANINVALKAPKGKYFVFTSVKRMDDNNRTFYNKLLKIK